MDDKMLEIVQLTSIADAIGAAFEMHTREDLLVNLDRQLYLLPRREEPFDVGCNPGQYTDDTQMTIAMARHLRRVKIDGYSTFSFERFIQDCLDVYDEDELEHGIPRGGHGGFVNVATFKGDRIAKQREFNSHKQDVGNGSGMRLNPFIVSDLTGEQLTEYIIGSTISTHNYMMAVIGNLVVVNVLQSLYNNSINARDVITHSLKWLNGDDLKSTTIFPNLATCKQVCMMVMTDFHIFGNFDETVDIYKEYLSRIDQLSDCNDDLTNIDHLTITEQHAKPCVKLGGSGLPARAKPTIGWFLYLLKNLHSCESTLSIIRRCLLIGGDTDTLAVYTFPISYIVFNRVHNKCEKLPVYIMEQLTETNMDLLKRRIGI